ncbi:hypothetical protein GWI33_004578 [Rhynchophorus ferrugineus]|uniref:ZP domain-containing protein n=1 Tax=Rhynchophorus ferrugineus TaxID=354439 RepID=A0A834IPV5_RHYFE|nr:hypothetical protein GWI33_004578 [Rhynchophorus ferrugineus]
MHYLTFSVVVLMTCHIISEAYTVNYRPLDRRDTNADQMVHNILQWVQNVYAQNSRRVRQGTLREYLPPANTEKPRPFQTGYPPSGFSPEPPFPFPTSPVTGGVILPTSLSPIGIDGGAVIQTDSPLGGGGLPGYPSIHPQVPFYTGGPDILHQLPGAFPTHPSTGADEGVTLDSLQPGQFPSQQPGINEVTSGPLGPEAGHIPTDQPQPGIGGIAPGGPTGSQPDISIHPELPSGQPVSPGEVPVLTQDRFGPADSEGPSSGGAPGQQGTTGSEGTPGTGGAPAAESTPGQPGAPSSQGFPGITGTTGLPGAPGSEGSLAGAPGSEGTPGIPGAPGFPGAPGTGGLPSSPGSGLTPDFPNAPGSGVQGVPGAPDTGSTPSHPGAPGTEGLQPGAPGSEGSSGLPGAPGSELTPGSEGSHPVAPGSEGTSGIPGAPGSEGSQPGSAGSEGSSGLPGAPGSALTPGLEGSHPGVPGSEGGSGIPGAPGSEGSQPVAPGSEGTQSGSPDSEGSSGLPGAPGSEGLHPGAPGSEGASGIPGAPGSEGSSGLPGAPGSTFTPDSEETHPGAPGSEGGLGIPGAIGSEVTPGSEGSQPGAPDSEGISGAPKAPGSELTPGSQGLHPGSPGSEGGSGTPEGPGSELAPGFPGAPGSEAFPDTDSGDSPSSGGSPSSPGAPGLELAPRLPEIPSLEGSPGVSGTPGTEGFPSVTGTSDSELTPGSEGSHPGAPGSETASGVPGAPGSESTPGAPTSEGSPGLESTAGSPAGPGSEGSSDLPGAPGTEGIPNVSGSPDQPTGPSSGVFPDISGAPGLEGSPDDSEKPSSGKPDSEGESGIPGSPGSEGASDTTGKPGLGGTVDATGTPGSEGAADKPEAPGSDASTGGPKGPGSEGEAGTPEAPGSQGQEGTPGAPESEETPESEIPLPGASPPGIGGDFNPDEVPESELRPIIPTERAPVPSVTTLAPESGTVFETRLGDTETIAPPTGQDNVIPGKSQGDDDDDSKHPPHIHSLDVVCGKEMMTITIEFNREFNGIIYSKGHYNNPECRYVQMNSGETKYTFMVNLNMCGTEFINALDTQNQSYLENVLVLQNEAGIQEEWDTVRSVRCLWEGNLKEKLSVAFTIGMLTQEIVTFSGDTAMAKLDVVLGRGPFGEPANGLVKIGEQMTLVVSVSGDTGFDVQVKECKAIDTVSKASVALTDDDGCVLKPKLFGAFQKTRETRSTGASIIAYAYFNAFKFPDEMDLTIECNVELCKANCDMCTKSQKLEPLKRRRRNAPNNETLSEGTLMGRRLRVILPEDVNERTILELTAKDHICMSTQSFLFGSAALISLALVSTIFSIFIWLKRRTKPYMQ